MRIFAATIAVTASLMLLVGCSSAETVPAPTVPETSAPAENTGPQGLTRPLTPFASAEVLAYCPDIEAISSQNLQLVNESDIESVYLCKIDMVGANPTEQAYKVENQVELLTAYSVSDVAPEPDTACVEMAADPLILWVKTVDGGTQAIYAPQDSCGFPIPSAAEAYQGAELSEPLASAIAPAVDVAPVS